LQNFALYAGLKTSLSKKSLTFVGHDTAGEPQTYSLRFRSEDAVKEFQAVLEKEIAQIKAS
jgi:nucleoporin NUP2